MNHWMCDDKSPVLPLRDIRLVCDGRPPETKGDHSLVSQREVIIFLGLILILLNRLHLNCVHMLNWIIWNWTVFDIETVLTLNWIVIYNYLNKLNSLK